MQQTNTLPAGTVLNSGTNTYRIIEVLGKGGFGITYKASMWTTVNGLPIECFVAIKEFFMPDHCERQADGATMAYSKPSAQTVERSRRDFIAEANRLKDVKVCHPGLVKIAEVFEANNSAYYVMEYLNGQSLTSFVEAHPTKRLSQAETLELLQPLLEAVDCLHKNKITHLDIKPDNVMLHRDQTDRLRPVLIDFGLAKHYDSAGNPTTMHAPEGFSKGYAAPEQMIQGAVTTFSPACDIYSLAATMAFCVTGKTPAAPDCNQNSPLAGIRPYVGKKLADVLIGCTQYRPSARPQSVAEMMTLLGMTPPAAAAAAAGCQSNQGTRTVLVPLTPREQDNKPKAEIADNQQIIDGIIVTDTPSPLNGGNPTTPKKRNMMLIALIALALITAATILIVTLTGKTQHTPQTKPLADTVAADTVAPKEAPAQPVSSQPEKATPAAKVKMHQDYLSDEDWDDPYGTSIYKSASAVSLPDYDLDLEEY